MPHRPFAYQAGFVERYRLYRRRMGAAFQPRICRYERTGFHRQTAAPNPQNTLPAYRRRFPLRRRTRRLFRLIETAKRYTNRTHAFRHRRRHPHQQHSRARSLDRRQLGVRQKAFGPRLRFERQSQTWQKTRQNHQRPHRQHPTSSPPLSPARRIRHRSGRYIRHTARRCQLRTQPDRQQQQFAKTRSPFV